MFKLKPKSWWVQSPSGEQSADPFFLMAGPNVIESEEHIFYMAKHIKAITAK